MVAAVAGVSALGTMADVIYVTPDGAGSGSSWGGPGVWAWSVKNGESPFDKRVRKLDDAMARLGVSRK